MIRRKEFREEIKNNIESYGFHITTVINGPEPRYSYSIGLKEKFGFELIFAGAIYYLKNDLYNIFNLAKDIESKGEENIKFKLNHVDVSWATKIALGVYDYYNIDEVNFFQIIPKQNYTLDIPDLSEKYNPNDSIWKWLNQSWEYSVPENSTVITNLDVLFGNEPIREVMRWEDDEWEMFSSDGSQFDKNDTRVVPLGLLLGLDQSLMDTLILEVGKGIWREERNTSWNKWN